MRTVCVSFCDLTLVLSYWYASDRFDLSILRTFYSIAIYSCFGTKRDFDLITPDILLSLVSVSSVVFDNLWYKLGEYPKQWKNSFLSWNNRMCIGKSTQVSRTGSDYTTLTFPSIQTLPSMPIANPEKHPDCLLLWSRDTIHGNQLQPGECLQCQWRGLIRTHLNIFINHSLFRGTNIVIFAVQVGMGENVQYVPARVAVYSLFLRSTIEGLLWSTP